MDLDPVYEGTAVGLLLIAAGELFGIEPVSLLGVGVFVTAVLVGFPVMTAALVTGTLRESTARVLDSDFDARGASNVPGVAATE